MHCNVYFTCLLQQKTLKIVSQHIVLVGSVSIICSVSFQNLSVVQPQVTQLRCYGGGFPLDRKSIGDRILLNLRLYDKIDAEKVHNCSINTPSFASFYHSLQHLQDSSDPGIGQLIMILLSFCYIGYIGKSFQRRSKS